MNQPNKEYSASEVLKMLQSLTGAVMNGDLQNTVFGNPEDSHEYDALASNVHAMRNNYVNRYVGPMLEAQRFKRVRAVAAATGTGTAGADLLSNIVNLNPEIGNAILGHHGANTAVESLLANANGIALAAGNNMGGLTDPHQMNRNMMWAATQGALAFGNNFDKYGAVNSKFTHGLSLNQSAAVTNNLLSESSIREEWKNEQLARTAEWRKKNPNGTNEQRLKEGILTEDEIIAFRRGTAMSEDAAKSFNDKIKSFQSGINDIISSISKITGDFDSAVDFLQDMTNGKAFSAGSEAASARKKAANMAANLRIMAAEGGVAPQEMYKMMYDPVEGFGNIFDRGRGRTQMDQMFGERSTTGNVSALAAGAFAEWKKAHPNATKAEEEKAKESIRQRVGDFAKGDAKDHNVLLAEAVRTGEMTMEEAQKLAASGNQENVAKRLKDIYGSDLRSITGDKYLMEHLTNQNTDAVNSLNNISLTEGYTNEGIMRGQRRALKSAKKMTIRRLSQALGKDVSSEVEKMHLSSVLDTDTLKEAGLSDEQISEVQRLAEDEHWSSADAAMKYIVKNYGADESEINRNAFSKLEGKISESYGKYDKTGSAIKSFSDINKKIYTENEVSKEELKQYRMNKKSSQVARKLSAIRNRYDNAVQGGNTEEIDKARQELADVTKEAISGNGDYAFNNAEFARFMIEDFVRNDATNKSTIQDDTARESIIDSAMNVYNRAREKNLSTEETMKAVGEFLTEKGENKAGLGGTFKGIDPGKRAELAERHERQQNVMAIVNAAMERAGISKEEQLTAATGAYTKLRNTYTDDRVKDIERKLVDSNGNPLTGEDKKAALYSLIAEELLVGNEKTGDRGILTPDQMTTDDARDILDKPKFVQNVLDRTRLSRFDAVGADIGKIEETTNGRDIKPDEKKEINRLKSYDSLNPFMKNRQGMYTLDAFGQAEADLSQDNLGTVSRADQIYADAKTKQFGVPTDDFDRDELVRKLKIRDKMGVISTLFHGRKDKQGRVVQKSLVDLANENLSDKQKKALTKGKSGPVEEQHLAEHFSSLLFKTRNMSEEDARKEIAGSPLLERIPEIRDMLLDAKDTKEKPIEARRLLASYVAAAGEKDEKKKKTKAEDGYMTQSVAEKDPSTINDTAVGYFKSMDESLKTLVQKQH